MEHPWTKGPVPTHEEVVNEFNQRNEQIKMAMDAEKASKEQEKNQRISEYEKDLSQST